MGHLGTRPCGVLQCAAVASAACQPRHELRVCVRAEPDARARKRHVTPDPFLSDFDTATVKSLKFAFETTSTRTGQV